jgi:transcriptional regulator with XRE-family HTH domain
VAKNKRKQPAPELRAIHRNIRALREAADLSQSELAALLDIDETAVSHWETGRASPRGKRLDDVANALEVSVSDLFADSEAA